jgi:hypothetical protein
VCLGGLFFVAGLQLTFGQGAPFEPFHDQGASITGAFEGWFKNKDGTFSFLLGYFNRNVKQEVDIPIGPENRIDPGGPDQGQPTFFLPGRQWGMFTVKAPADFGTKKLTWTITANGQTTVIPLSLNPDYEIAPFREAAGDEPPVLSLEEHGKAVQGPGTLLLTRQAKVGTPLSLKVWVADDQKIPSGSGAVSKARMAHPVTLTWSKFRGPGPVTFSNPRPDVEKVAMPEVKLPFAGTSTTDASFSVPGEYLLEVVANDYSGEGGAGFQCCWTSAQIKVSVEK